jgi:hypothetical protein
MSAVWPEGRVGARTGVRGPMLGKGSGEHALRGKDSRSGEAGSACELWAFDLEVIARWSSRSAMCGRSIGPTGWMVATMEQA